MFKSLRLLLVLSALVLTAMLLKTPSATVSAQGFPTPCMEWDYLPGGACAPTIEPEIVFPQPQPSIFQICKTGYAPHSAAYYSYCFTTFQSGTEWWSDTGLTVNLAFVDPGASPMDFSVCPNNTTPFAHGSTNDFLGMFTYDELYVTLQLKPFYCLYFY